MKNMMEYKGYHATIEYNDQDQCFFGTITGIADVVSFEGSSTSELKVAFAEAVAVASYVNDGKSCIQASGRKDPR